MEENVVKKNNTIKYVVIIALVAIVIIGLVAGWYFYKSNNPKTVFTSSINGAIDNFTEEMSDVEEIKSQNTTFKLSANVNSDIQEVKQVAEYINKLSLDANVQIDYESKKELVNLDVNYDNDKIIDGQVYYDVTNKELYLYVEELFNKYFKFDTSSKEYNEINKMMDELLQTQKQMKLGEKVSLKKASKILKEKISSKLSKEYFSKEKAEVTVNDKKVKTTKFKLTLTQTQFIDILSSICSELSEDEEFLNCWEDKDDIKDGLSKLSEQLKDVDKDDNLKIEFNIYKKGLLNEFVKFEVIMSEDDENVSAEVTKTAKDTYSYRVSTKTDEEVEIKGTIKTTKLDKDSYRYEFTINVPEFGEIALNFEFSNKINQGIEEINKSNSVELEKLTQNDLTEIQENLQKMKIYKLLEPLMSSSSNKLSDLTTDNNTILDKKDDKENDKDKDNDNKTSSTTTNSNSVKAYSGDVIVSYSVPSSFKVGSYNNDNYKTYQKSDDVDVTITVESDTLEEYINEIEQNKERFEKSENYKDVKISDIQTLEVNGKKFSYKTLEYTYISSVSSKYDIKNKDMYVYYDIDGKNNFNLEIENADNITQEELHQFLNITVTK